MKKRLTLLVLLLLLAGLLPGCCLSHQWQEADCETAKTCAKCQKTSGEPLGHSWEILCEEPERCLVCGITRGEAPGHSWVDASCEMPKHCSVCAAAEGDPLGHTLENTTLKGKQNEVGYELIYTGTCKTCGEEVREDPMQAFLGDWTCKTSIEYGQKKEVDEGWIFVEFPQTDRGCLVYGGKADYFTMDPNLVAFSPSEEAAPGETGYMTMTATMRYDGGDTIRAIMDGENMETLRLEMDGVPIALYMEKGREITEGELEAQKLIVGSWECKFYGVEGKLYTTQAMGLELFVSCTEDGNMEMRQIAEETTENKGVWKITYDLGRVTDENGKPLLDEPAYAYSLNSEGRRWSGTLSVQQEPLGNGLIDAGPVMVIDQGTLQCYLAKTE